MSLVDRSRTAAERVTAHRDAALDQPLHDERTAAILGIGLGVTFTVCFLTGLYSHLLQQPPSWWDVPATPAGLYRITQGLHVATGLATIPLLLAKLWSVHPRLLTWPPARSLPHLLERLLLVVLVSGAVFQLFTGTANILRWYPWRFFFPTGHYWVSWMVMGALVAHIGAKAPVTAHALGRKAVVLRSRRAETPIGRRGFLAATAGAMGLVTLFTVGQTVAPLRKLAIFAPRRPDIGPQGLPVNQTANEAGVVDASLDPGWRLRISGAVARPIELDLAALRAMDQRTADLPIACVEGWSAQGTWRGVPVVQLLQLAGVAADRRLDVEVRSLEANGLYGRSRLSDSQARHPDTLLALELNGEALHLDHGFPCRLIGPNRPGVLQTKWVTELVVS